MCRQVLGEERLNRIHAWHLPGHPRDRQELGSLKTPGPEASLRLCVTVVSRSTGLCKPPLMAACSPELGRRQVFPEEKEPAVSGAPLVYKRGSRVSGRQGTYSRSQSCPEAELQLRMTFSDLKVTVVSVTPQCHPWREADVYLGCFLGILICALLSLWGTCPDFLS